MRKSQMDLEHKEAAGPGQQIQPCRKNVQSDRRPENKIQGYNFYQLCDLGQIISLFVIQLPYDKVEPTIVPTSHVVGD